MLMSNSMKTKFYGGGLKAGLPFTALEGVAGALDASGNPSGWIRRRSLAKQVVAGSDWRGFLTHEMGLATFAPGEIPGLENIHIRAQEIYREREAETLTTEPNPFYTVLRNEDVANYPELIEAALSQPLLEIMCDYFGTVPRLQYVNMWMVRPSQNTYGSQLFHLDKPDVHFVTVFVNVFPCGPENGPTTALSAKNSKIVRAATKYDEIYFRHDGRLSDREVLRHCREEDLLSLPEEAGAGGICDTSTCLHYGSRCKSGKRVTLVFQYGLAHKISGSPTALLRGPANMDSVRNLFLDPNQ